MITIATLTFPPIVLDILKIGLPGLCFLLVAYNFHLFFRAQQDTRSLLSEILELIKTAKLSPNNFTAFMSVINGTVLSKNNASIPVKFATVTFGFAILVLIFQVVSPWLTPKPIPSMPDPIPKELSGVWYYNSLTENSRKIHGGYCELVIRDGKAVFHGKRLYTFQKKDAGEEWSSNFDVQPWYSDPVIQVGNDDLLFHYQLTKTDGTVAEGVCFGSISGSGAKQEIFGRILTDVTTQGPGAGLNIFVRDNRWPQNADHATKIPAWN